MQQRKEECPMANIVTPKEKEVRVMRSIRMPQRLDDEITRIAEETGASKTLAMEQLLEAGIRLHRGEWQLRE